MTTADVVPAPAAPGMFQRTFRRGLKKKTKSPVVKVSDSISRMIGESDNSDSASGSIFPDGSDEYTGSDETPPEDRNNVTPQASVGLIDPSVALVAPDVTPNIRVPIDPSKVPQFNQGGALSVLGVQAHQPPQPTTQLATQLAPVHQAPRVPTAEESLRAFGVDPSQVMHHFGGTPSQGASVINDHYDPIQAATTGGVPMPEHVVNPNSASKIIEAARDFIR